MTDREARRPVDREDRDHRDHREPQEYRMEELAAAAGISVRTLRFYRERKLVPPPRRDGRIAWYSEAHLARLRVIAALLERGHTLGGIAELLTAWEDGRDVGELLGLETQIATPWSDETPVRLTWEELAATYGGQVSEQALQDALALGYLTVDGETVTHVSRRLLESSAALVHEGVPLTVVLEASRHVRECVDDLADRFVELACTHVLTRIEDTLLPGEATRLADALARLRPVAKNVIEAEFALAMDRRVRNELDEILLRHRAPEH